MHVLVHGRVGRVQPQVAPLGPVAATGRGMAAQARGVGGQVDGSRQADHGRSRGHPAVIRFDQVIALAVHLAEHVRFGLPVDVGDRLGVGRVSDEFSLVGVAVTHQAVDVLGLGRVRGIAVGAHMAGKTGVFRGHGVGAEGVDPAQSLAQFLAFSVGQLRGGGFPPGVQAVHHLGALGGMAAQAGHRAVVPGDGVVRGDGAENRRCHREGAGPGQFRFPVPEFATVGPIPGNAIRRHRIVVPGRAAADRHGLAGNHAGAAGIFDGHPGRDQRQGPATGGGTGEMDRGTRGHLCG